MAALDAALQATVSNGLWPAVQCAEHQICYVLHWCKPYEGPNAEQRDLICVQLGYEYAISCSAFFPHRAALFNAEHQLAVVVFPPNWATSTVREVILDYNN